MVGVQTLGVRDLAISAPLRLVLYSGEMLRLKNASGRIRVLQGLAWLSSDGADLVLRKGGESDYRSSRVPILVSAFGGESLVLELDGKRTS